MVNFIAIVFVALVAAIAVDSAALEERRRPITFQHGNTTYTLENKKACPKELENKPVTVDGQTCVCRRVKLGRRTLFAFQKCQPAGTNTTTTAAPVTSAPIEVTTEADIAVADFETEDRRRHRHPFSFQFGNATYTLNKTSACPRELENKPVTVGNRTCICRRVRGIFGTRFSFTKCTTAASNTTTTAAPVTSAPIEVTTTGPVDETTVAAAAFADFEERHFRRPITFQYENATYILGPDSRCPKGLENKTVTAGNRTCLCKKNRSLFALFRPYLFKNCRRAENATTVAPTTLAPEVTTTGPVDVTTVAAAAFADFEERHHHHRRPITFQYENVTYTLENKSACPQGLENKTVTAGNRTCLCQKTRGGPNRPNRPDQPNRPNRPGQPGPGRPNRPAYSFDKCRRAPTTTTTTVAPTTLVPGVTTSAPVDVTTTSAPVDVTTVAATAAP